MMESYFVRGFLIGLLFGIPVGAVGTLTVQRTFQYGFFAGLKTGLGSSVADCLYAVCGAFGLTLISDFLLENQMLISIVGGCLIFGMGARLLLKKSDMANNQYLEKHLPKSNQAESKQTTGNIGMFLSSFAIGITNPAAILTFLFAFSYFGITGTTAPGQGILLVAGVFAGTFFWWTLLSASVVLIKKRTGNHGFRYMNQLFGTILALLGAAVIIRTVLDLIR